MVIIMKISLMNQFYKNLRHPKQSAMFRFLKVGYNITYCFFLTLIVAILFSPTIIRQSIHTSETLSYFFVPLMLVLYYILLCSLSFFFVSCLSAIVLPIKKMLKRKLDYLQIWSITINAMTWPTLFLAVINLAFTLPILYKV